MDAWALETPGVSAISHDFIKHMLPVAEVDRHSGAIQRLKS